ncbi:acetoacetate decarboxylase family protein [Streptomyces sp. NPDC059445]|uniref:acetoacetate decarboxylase family protein n=1 Tax=Streptomyces sp. NPDC059445 TaxID=3346832 RepID=UPI0036C6EB3B
MTRYPEEPWHLAGRMYLSLWLVPARELPRVADGTRPVTVAGRGAVGAAWVVYENDSVLHYNELLRAVLVRDGGRPRVCITDIWVDSPASMTGGRELWGIPKELAEFAIDRTAVDRTAVDRTAVDRTAVDGTAHVGRADLGSAEVGTGGVGTGAAADKGVRGRAATAEGVVATAATDEGVLAGAFFEPGRRLPGRWPLTYRVTQTLDGALKTSSVRSRSAVRAARARWITQEDSPLGELGRRPPLLSLVLDDFTLRFGDADLTSSARPAATP